MIDQEAPEACKTCGKYHAYKRGQCYECFAADECEHHDNQREERKLREQEGA